MDKLIIDLTRANFGTEDQLVNEATSYSYAKHVLPNNTVIVRRQIQRIQNIHKIREEIIVNGLPEIINRVTALISGFLADKTVGTVYILTFNRAVFEVTNFLPDADKVRVVIQSFSQARRAAGFNVKQQFSWPEHIVAQDEAVKVLVEALKLYRANTKQSAIRKTDLRFVLGQVDARFRRDSSTPLPQGCVTALLVAASQSSVIALDATNDESNPYIWLSGTTVDHVIEATDGQGSSSVDAVSRSQKFLDTLKANKLGPFSKIRPKLYGSIESEIASGPVSIGDLITRAICAVRGGNPDGNVPWRMVREFIINLLTLRPVLLDEQGSPLVPSFRTLSVKVYQLCPDWRRDLDGELVLSLVKAGHEIVLSDIPSLAGALLLARDETAIDHMSSVIGHLLETQRIMESEENHRLVLP